MWTLLLRIVFQFQCSKPREFDASRSLRFFFLGAVFFNASTFWFHARDGASEGRSIILDFVGMSFKPSKLQLLSLDLLILFLQLTLTNIAYEASLSEADANEDALAPLPSPTHLQIPSASSIKLDDSDPPAIESPYILDLRFSTTIARLRKSAPPPSSGSNSNDTLLPLPNTTPWPLPTSLRMMVRANAQARRLAQAQVTRDNAPTVNDGGEGRIPGGLDDRVQPT
ncbi:hypothetical protein ONZ45_g1333 [Pleurotus djamor]|nr:hypothetical protein ONZ45_g1333 [Pleurotus djamor]